MEGVALTSGAVTDRPWGITLASLGLGGRTGQLTLAADDGKHYCIAFRRGAVVGASSPLAADSVARVALTSCLVTSSQVRELTRRIAAAPPRDDQDDVALLAEHVPLAPAQLRLLRRRLVAQRAARTFAVERGALLFDCRVAIHATPDLDLDVRAVIHLGARQHLSQQRLADAVRTFGSRFVLRAGADAALDAFELDDAHRPIVDALRAGTTLPELEARHREVDPRAAQAVVYALAACGAVEASAPVRLAPVRASTDVSIPRAPTPRAPIVSRVPTPRAPIVSRVPTPRAPIVSRVPSELGLDAHATTLRPNALTAHELRALVNARLALVDQGADHFAVLGVPFAASVDTVRAAYVEASRNLRAARLAELELSDDDQLEAQRLFAQLGIAYTVLTDPNRRAAYLANLQNRAATAADNHALALAAARRAEAALRDDRPDDAVADAARARELEPTDLDHLALHAWASFCAARDKAAVAAPVRRALERAIFKAPHPEIARFYLGRVERMLGRDHVALDHFREVLDVAPEHAEAAAEVRVLEARVRTKRR